jgi:hypothetical protein
VAIGNDKRASYILDDDEIPPPDMKTIEVPVEHRDRFEWDVDESLRNLAGVATTGTWHFFPNRERLYDCIDSTRTAPFNVEVVDTLGLRTSNLLSEYMNERRLFQIRSSHWAPIINPGAPRFVHIDIGLNNDAMGLAVAHRVMKGQEVAVYYDIVLRIRAPQGDEVNLQAIIEFLKYLRSKGMAIESVSYDQFQSRHSIQILKMAGFEASLHSVSKEDYDILKSLVTSGLCSYYEYDPLLTELEELRKNMDMMLRPSHPAEGSDDVADAVAALAGLLCSAKVKDVVKVYSGHSYRPVVAVGQTIHHC